MVERAQAKEAARQDAQRRGMSNIILNTEIGSQTISMNDNSSMSRYQSSEKPQRLYEKMEMAAKLRH